MKYVEEFIQAIREKTNVRLTFHSKEDLTFLTRRCAPMDFGPSRRTRAKDDRFHLWDFESDKAPHVLSLSPIQIAGMEFLEDHFDPSEFVSWDTTSSPWHVPRDWGTHS